MKKNIFILCLLWLIFVMAMPVSATEFAGGSGTVDDPYQISKPQHLDNIRLYPNAHFELISDVVFSYVDFLEDGAFYNNGEGWIPIGTSLGASFSGVLNGNGYAVYGLKINSYIEDGGNIGLFGYNTGTIIGLGLENSNINVITTSYYSYIGGIVGQNDNGIIDACYNNASIKVTSPTEMEGHYGYVGGIVGYNKAGMIRNSYCSGNISSDGLGYSYIGGICGYHRAGTIQAAYNIGSINSRSSKFGYSGGIVGNNYKGMVSNTYNAGTIDALSSYFSYSGGIAGSNSGSVYLSYNVGNILGRYCGGIVGTDQNGVLENCYFFDITESAVGYGEGIAGKLSSAEMMMEDSFVGFNFMDTWSFDIVSGYYYPRLQWQTINETILFDDVILGIDWFAPYVYDVVAYGVINGKGYRENGIPYFEPQGNIKRGEFCKILAVASGDDISSYDGYDRFDDVSGHWSSAYVNWAYENRIVNGFPDGRFCPNDPISREQMAVMICRYAVYQEIELLKTTDRMTFVDDDQITWSSEYVYTMQQSGIIQGYFINDKYYFKPKGNSTRAEAATMISKFFDL